MNYLVLHAQIYIHFYVYIKEQRNYTYLQIKHSLLQLEKLKKKLRIKVRNIHKKIFPHTVFQMIGYLYRHVLIARTTKIDISLNGIRLYLPTFICVWSKKP